MKLHSIAMCCLVLLGFCFGCETRPATGNRAGDEQVIRGMETGFSNAVAAKNLAVLVSLYADDAALYYQDHPAVIGKEAIHERWKAIFSKPGFQMSTEPLEVRISRNGNFAFSHGTYKATRGDGAGTTEQGEYAVVYKKQADGNWKIVADNGNSQGLPAHSLRKPGNRRYDSSTAIQALIGSIGLIASFVFLFGMPIALLTFAWQYLQTRELPTGLVASAAMLIAFLVTALLLWKHLSTYYWNLSFRTAFQAAGDAASYGHPMEHTAEVLVINLLIFSTLSAAVAGAITGGLRRVWVRRRSLAAVDL